MPQNLARYDIRRIKTTLAQYQEQVIICHCKSCQRPCCKLTDVVLEFDWRRLKRFYTIDVSQKAFDYGLRHEQIPEYIRKQDGLYYAHGSPCPAYNIERHQCRYYSNSLKPQNCTDFPVYLDGGTVVADTRCEALDVNDLLHALRSNNTDRKFSTGQHPEFPMLNYIDIE